MPLNVAGRTGAVRAAEREVKSKLTRTQRSCVVLLDPVRAVDWATKNGKELQKELKNQCHRDAVLLQARGEEASEPCSQCAMNGGVFQSCVAAHEVSKTDGKRRVLLAGACANCIWHSKGPQYEFYGGKSAHWDSERRPLMAGTGTKEHFCPF
ncbi:hypothetical protein IFM61606_03724 [Aspergillus udagawae]|nr:hypothetical protein IFM61606_03724 [Aspergillus udagawae]